MKLTQILQARRQFQYFKRYVEREMQKEHYIRKWHPLTGFKEYKRKTWYYGEHRPWTTSFREQTKLERKSPAPVIPMKIGTFSKEM